MPTREDTPLAALPRATFELHAGRFQERALRVSSFRGRERMSRNYAFDVAFTAAHDGGGLAEELLGRPATLRLLVDGHAARCVRGVVGAVGPEGHHPERGETHYRLRLVPQLWLLRQTKTSRIFQHRSVVEVVTEVLAGAGVAHAWRLGGAYEPKTYCVQYRESDYDFVARLLAEEGIFFYFRQPSEQEARDGASETLILSDQAHYPWLGDAAEPPRLVFRNAEGVLSSDGSVEVLAFRHAVRPAATLLRDYDFTRPLLNPAARAGDDPNGAGGAAEGHRELLVYEHEGDYLEPSVTRPGAERVLEQRRRKALVGRGASGCRRLAPGHAFVLTEHEIPDNNRALVVTAVDHEGRVQAATSGAEPHAPSYHNTFACIGAESTFRPRRKRRAVAQVLETATVVGPAGEEIHTDPHGRIRVAFHWDLAGHKNERSSCWLRVSQVWAGASWGAQFVPRVGMEVLVSFLGGDPDRPVVLGCLYNTQQPPTHLLPRHATRSGIRTQTVGGTGYNEIAFEDQKGSERLSLHAERDLDVVVEHDHALSVGLARHGAADGGNQTIRVGRHQTVEVAGNRSDTVRGDARAAIGGDRRAVVGGDERVTVHGNRRARCEGAVDEFVGTHHHRIVEGDAIDDVYGAARTFVKKSRRVQVKGSQHTIVGETLGFAAGDECSVGARQIVLEARESIRFVCGDSSIELSSEEIVLEAPKITLKGTDVVSLQAKNSSLHLATDTATVSVKDLLDVRGKTVTLHGEDATVALSSGSAKIDAKKEIALHAKAAAVVLDSDAAIDGGKVKLNCGSADAAEGFEEPEPDALATSWVELELVDQDGDAVPCASYVVEAAGKKILGTLDAEGRARVPIRPGAAKVSFPDFDADGWKVA